MSAQGYRKLTDRPMEESLVKEDGRVPCLTSGGPARQSLRGAEIHGHRSCQSSSEPANFSKFTVYFRRFQPAGKVCAVAEPGARQCFPLSDPQPNQGIELRGRVPGQVESCQGVFVETSISQRHGQLKAAVEDRLECRWLRKGLWVGMGRARSQMIGENEVSGAQSVWFCSLAWHQSQYLSLYPNQRHPDIDLTAEDVDRCGSISKL